LGANIYAGKIKAVREAAHALREGFPWLLTPLREEARIVIFRAGFPRSIAGARQDDQLWRVIYFTKQLDQGTETADLVRLAIAVNGFLSPPEELKLPPLEKHAPRDLRDLFYIASATRQTPQTERTRSAQDPQRVFLRHSRVPRVSGKP
jgi:hypothetical protein